jgi:hypothetical protein
MKKIRGLTTLTNEEIIGLVNLLIPSSRLRTEGASIIDDGDMAYRKIEVKLPQSHRGILIKVTHSEEIDSEREVGAFIIEDNLDDISIIPVNRTKFEKWYVNLIGITYDFSIIEQSCKKTYMYFAENLQLWNLTGIEFEVNKDISDDWYTVDETIADF